MAGNDVAMRYLILCGAAIIETSRNKKEGQRSDDRVHYRTNDAHAHCGQYQQAHFLRVYVLHESRFFDFFLYFFLLRQFLPSHNF